MLGTQQLEQALLALDGAGFQNVCDAYLHYTEKEYPTIIRSGSQKGKRQAIKGTPDSYYLTPTGKYVLIQYTTEKRDGRIGPYMNKAKTDIAKCLDPEKTGLQQSQIEKVIFCCTATLPTADRDELISYACNKHVRLDIRMLDHLVQGIIGRCAHVAKDYLGISIDTAQVQPIKKFIEDYEHTGFATKLSTPFLSRDNELAALNSLVENNRLVIIHGAPGTGKTRMAIECLEKLETGVGSWSTYCISNKQQDIFDDLRKYLLGDQDYILLIDDANKQEKNMLSLLALLSEKRTGRLRIVTTVRDYALDVVRNACASYNPAMLEVTGMTDEQITEVLKSKPYEIGNPEYRDRILHIADGNIRLAVMAAQVALDTQRLYALWDVTDIYEQYFKKSIAPEVFTNSDLLRVLGIVSFLHTVHLLNESSLKKIEKVFGVSKNIFLDGVHQLHRWELVDFFKDQILVRISEQTLATYFFYYTFFKERLLKFSAVLQEYFDTELYRIRESVLPATITLGYLRLQEAIEPSLTVFYQQVRRDEERSIKFMETFWYYQPDECLAMVDRHIRALPSSSDINYRYNERSGLSTIDEDKYLGLLSQFYFQHANHLENAVELTLDLIQRKPSLFTACVRHFKSDFVFRYEDEKYDFHRQQKLVEVLQRPGYGPLAQQLVAEVMPFLLHAEQQSTSGGRKRNSFTLTTFAVPLTAGSRVFREKVWEFVATNLCEDEVLLDRFITSYKSHPPRKHKEPLQFDSDFLTGIIAKRFKRTSFIHCLIVQELDEWWKVLHIKQPKMNSLQRRFTNQQLDLYFKLVYDRYKGLTKYELQYDMEKYARLKDAEIKNAFRFANIASFRRFLQNYAVVNHWMRKKNHDLNHALDIVLAENYQYATQRTIGMVHEIIHKANEIIYRPWRLFQQLSTDSVAYEALHQQMILLDFAEKERWMLNWFIFLPANAVSRRDVTEILHLLQNLSHPWTVEPSEYGHFLQAAPRFYQQLILTVYEHNERSDHKLSFNHHFFERYGESVSDDLSLLKMTYMQQDAIHPNFDHDKRDLLFLLQKDKHFLIDYLTFWKKHQRFGSKEYEGLSSVWKLEDAETLVEEAMDWLVVHPFTTNLHHFSHFFFMDLETNRQARAIAFLEKYLEKHFQEVVKVNMVFECIRYVFPGQLKTFVHRLLELNLDAALFKSIQWTKSMITVNRSTTWGDIRAGEYQRILDIVEESPLKSYLLADHKTFLKLRIAQERQSGEEERWRNFWTGED